jgi:phage tail-like protein
MINPLALGAALSAPLQGFRFFVMFVENLAFPMVLDMRFNKVSGLTVSAELKHVDSGGENNENYWSQGAAKYQNLVLSRGMPLFSPLRGKLEASLTSAKHFTATVFVFLQDESGLPVAAWQFENARPVKWQFSDLDASQGGAVIETIELAYERFTKLI